MGDGTTSCSTVSARLSMTALTLSVASNMKCSLMMESSSAVLRLISIPPYTYRLVARLDVSKDCVYHNEHECIESRGSAEKSEKSDAGGHRGRGARPYAGGSDADRHLGSRSGA